MHYTYLLKSEKDHGYYIGYSSNLQRRMHEHLNGLVDATKHRHPIRLLYYEAYKSESDAREREVHLKQFGSAYIGPLKRLKEK